jgi:hypothetical protein
MRAYMNMSISPELDKILEDSPYKPSEYFRRAIALYQLATEETRRGHKIAVLDSHGKVLQEIIGL